jgi:hypothetical protein
MRIPLETRIDHQLRDVLAAVGNLRQPPLNLDSPAA